ncbi:MAG: phage portal protein, partial [Alphaproteobacteria bacterium]|nr:phage portal protein [Alphaproteobacteria bacterium]
MSIKNIIMECKMFNLLKHFNTRNKECIFTWQGSNPTWTPSNYTSLVSEGFFKNVFVYRAINLISSGISSIPIIVKNQDLSENEKMTELFARPNALQGRSSFMTTLVNYLMLAGNAFIHFNGKELNCLRPDRVRVVPNDSMTAPESYVYEVDRLKIPLRKNDILHIKLSNPLSDWYGFAPIQAATQATDQYNEMSKHNLGLLQNGGRPSGCLILKNINGLTDEQRQQLRQDITETYAGARNAGKMMVLEGGFEWKEMGFSPKDLDFDVAKNSTAREIIQAFGVPPILVGIRGDASFNNKPLAKVERFVVFMKDKVLRFHQKQLSKSQIINSCNDIKSKM